MATKKAVRGTLRSGKHFRPLMKSKCQGFAICQQVKGVQLTAVERAKKG